MGDSVNRGMFIDPDKEKLAHQIMEHEGIKRLSCAGLRGKESGEALRKKAYYIAICDRLNELRIETTMERIYLSLTTKDNNFEQLTEYNGFLTEV